MYKEVLEEKGIKQTEDFTLSVLSYEIGKLHQIKVYKERFGSSGFIGDEEAELGDALTQICLLIEQKGFSIDKCRVEGFERFQHRIQEVALAELKRRHK